MIRVRIFSKILKELNTKEKFSIFIIGILNCIPLLIDAFALFLTGLTSLIGYNYFTGANYPEYINNFIIKYNFLNLNIRDILYILIGFIIFLFILKTILSLIITSRMFKYLSKLAANSAECRFNSLKYINRKMYKKLNQEQLAFVLTDGILAIYINLFGGLIIAISETIFLLSLSTYLLIMNTLMSISLIGTLGLLLLASNKLISSGILKSGQLNVESSIRGKEILKNLRLLHRELVLSGGFKTFNNEFATNRNLASIAIYKLNFLQLFPKYLLEFVAIITGSIVILFNLGSESDALVGSTFFIIALSRMLPSIMKIQSALVSIQSMFGSLPASIQVFDSLDTIKDIPKPAEVKPGENLSLGVITVRNLKFRYSLDSHYIFKDMNFEIHPNSLVLIKGKTGAGKSTLLEILMGFVTDYDGEVYIEDKNPRDFVHMNPGSISFIPQEINLIQGSILDNITLGNAELDVNRLNAVLSDSLIQELVDNLKLGLHTGVGDLGNKLSGGQRQRIVIARALYSNPKYLFLDEPTSALDPETERAFIEILSSLKRRMTIILVSHRETFDLIADNIIKVE